MSRRLVLVLLTLGVFMATLLSSTLAYTGGWSDGDEDYNCGGSCHVGPTNHGTGTIVVSADKESVITGQFVVVTVNVTETQLGDNSRIGVFLLRSLTGQDDTPSMDGWQVLQDPKGGSYNYVEKTSPGSGETVAFSYTLRAPATPGDYTLYARVHHGSTARNALWEDSTAFVLPVTPIPPGVPTIDHTPVSVAFVGRGILIQAWVVNATTGVFLHWKHTEETEFSSVEMTNTSETSDGAFRYEATIPAMSEETQVHYYLVATRDTLYTDTATFTMTLILEPEKPNMLAWGLQIIIILEAIAIGAYLSIRLSGVKRRAGEEE